jgi:hypothetical protein
MGIFEFIFYTVLSSSIMSAMAPSQTNNTAQYDAEAAEARRNAERRELKKERASASSGLDTPLFFSASLDSSNIFPWNLSDEVVALRHVN